MTLKTRAADTLTGSEADPIARCPPGTPKGRTNRRLPGPPAVGGQGIRAARQQVQLAIELAKTSKAQCKGLHRTSGSTTARRPAWRPRRGPTGRNSGIQPGITVRPTHDRHRIIAVGISVGLPRPGAGRPNQGLVQLDLLDVLRA